MRIEGKSIADRILFQLKEKKVIPTLAVILVGDDPSSLSFIKQKQKAMEVIGGTLTMVHLPQSITKNELAQAIVDANLNPTIHGVIVQRPIPAVVGNVTDILNTVAAKKDVDGFLPHSPFEVPVAKAVLTILTYVHAELFEKKLVADPFMSWLTRQPIAVVGRGETAGAPISSLFAKYGCTASVIHSQTPNPYATIKQASIVISCVGKQRIITKRMISQGSILISVGLSRDNDGKLHGDYEEDDIKDIASFYTPTPGGVGPVNVACLIQNCTDACEMLTL